MAQIQWDDVPQKNTGAKKRTATSSVASDAVTPTPIPPTSGNMWFAISMGLFGIIVGFGVAKWQGGGLTTMLAPTVAQVPTAPTPTPPPDQPPAPSEPVPPIDPEKDHIRGDLSKAQVAVIEYSDFECPFCKSIHPTMQQIAQTYGDKVVLIYRHFPLSFHANAQKEAEASECAASLGGNDAFWKYHDKIFEKTTSGGTGIALDQLPAMAKEIGLNETRFKSCLDAGTFAKVVQDQMNAGGQAGVSGTPGNFVLNLRTQKSQAVEGAQPFASFKTAIDAALASS